jgi:hypothetical protein
MPVAIPPVVEERSGGEGLSAMYGVLLQSLTEATQKIRRATIRSLNSAAVLITTCSVHASKKQGLTELKILESSDLVAYQMQSS